MEGATGGLDAVCLAHVRGTGMNVKKYLKIANFVDQIVKGENVDEKELLEKFAKKCYASFSEKDGLRQAKKFLKVLFGDDLTVLVNKGCNEALKSAAGKAPDVMRIVRLNRPNGSFTKKLDKYQIGETLGKGATSKVKLGRNEETGQEVALKILTDGSFNKEDLRKEIAILKDLDHPNVIRLYDSYDNVADAGSTSKTTTVIVLELATKGELFDFFMYTGFFQPPLARWFFKQMLAGLEYCHNKGVAHRDLKPENCLLGDGFLIKLVDFGFATMFKSETGEQKMLTALGTPGYAAPEILKRKKYTKNVDIFSLGVILFITIAGFPPFQEAKPENDWWFHKLAKKKFALFWKAHERTAKFSPEAKELLVGMLAASPDDRWTIEKIKSCDWYKGKTMSQEEAVKELLMRKAKVETEKIQENAPEMAKETMRSADTGIRAPVIGTYKPPNAFYCQPGLTADVIRQVITDCITANVMGIISKEYLETGDDTVPEAPEDIKEEDWNPWWDIAFKCSLEENTGPDTPPMKYEFEGIVYIREDPSYTASPEEGGKVRHIVYFKRRKGLVHKWIKAMFKIQSRVGFFHVQPESVPKASPVVVGREGIAA